MIPKIPAVAVRQAKQLLEDANRGCVISQDKVLARETLAMRIAGVANASDQEMISKLAGSYVSTLQELVSRCMLPLSAYTYSVEEWRCNSCDYKVLPHHIHELWGKAEREGESWGKLGVGMTVIDNIFEESVIRRAHMELEQFRADHQLDESKDACNTGAYSIWLRFETPEDRQKLPPALSEICVKLAGLPDALKSVAKLSSNDRPGQLGIPQLRVEAKVMAATYDHGAEYQYHKDSYDGADNSRMLTVLLYVNPDWDPADNGELRVFAGNPKTGDGKQTDTGKEPYADIVPMCGRLVVLQSREVWHAVRMPKKPRWALTLWVMAD
eukprot:gnl/MRDRNA2_/MRDRNA2_173297_c0_seq1.p1 gnl/MRDRNA2_/MRDRNA2_173297_c0~~gnl/MRDRNA2_/MRDRNA2_173297_c0_seq1.p1  ORF type:complete len:376 (-),score=72.17 gnl/MRDRNA2_/MRDRNA2_173297_c0_seq1:338-1315(-)